MSLLTEVRKLLSDPKNWMNEAEDNSQRFFDKKKEEMILIPATKWCVVGALKKVREEQGMKFEHPDNLKTFWILGWVAQKIGFPYFADFECAKKRKHSEVIEALDYAILFEIDRLCPTLCKVEKWNFEVWRGNAWMDK